ncbi:hypothetical protein EV426DRAFT_616894 [Tirmania nivea]|nr:hypothetical protein EV426DRAFT_616894 [Tirmania nivea]
MSTASTSCRGPAVSTSHPADLTPKAEYRRLRSLAHSAHAKRNSCNDRSLTASIAGKKELAVRLKIEGNKHGRDGEEYHRQARDYIFRVNNANRAGDEIDLHGLYVAEAKEILNKRIRAERARGTKGLHVIVGKGNHSTGGIQKIKPAVKGLCRKLNLQFSTEENAGRMYISLAAVDGRQQPREVPASDHPRPVNRPQKDAPASDHTRPLNHPQRKVPASDRPHPLNQAQKEIPYTRPLNHVQREYGTCARQSQQQQHRSSGAGNGPQYQQQLQYRYRQQEQEEWKWDEREERGQGQNLCLAFLMFVAFCMLCICVVIPLFYPDLLPYLLPCLLSVAFCGLAILFVGILLWYIYKYPIFFSLCCVLIYIYVSFNSQSESGGDTGLGPFLLLSAGRLGDWIGLESWMR